MNYYRDEHTCTDRSKCKYYLPQPLRDYFFKSECTECKTKFKKEVLCPQCELHCNNVIKFIKKRQLETKSNLCKPCTEITNKEEIERERNNWNERLCDNCLNTNDDWINPDFQIIRCGQIIRIKCLLCKNCKKIPADELKFIQNDYPI